MSDATKLSCVCGFFTTQIDYLRVHFADGACQPTAQHGAAFQTRLMAIARETESHRTRLALLQGEQDQINLILRLIERPIVRKPKPRHCVICHKPTLEFFGESPQCRKHVKGNDDVAVGGKTVGDILSGLLGGKK